MEIQEFAITFGVQYGRRKDADKHPMGMFGDGYAVIEAPSAEVARALAFAAFGEKWSFQYPMEKFATRENFEQYYPAGELMRLAWQTTEIRESILEEVKNAVEGFIHPETVDYPEGTIVVSSSSDGMKRDALYTTDRGERTEFAKGRDLALAEAEARTEAEEVDLSHEELSPWIWHGLGSKDAVAEHAHVHTLDQICIKNRFGLRCTTFERGDEEE